MLAIVGGIVHDRVMSKLPEQGIVEARLISPETFKLVSQTYAEMAELRAIHKGLSGVLKGKRQELQGILPLDQPSKVEGYRPRVILDDSPWLRVVHKKPGKEIYESLYARQQTPVEDDLPEITRTET